MVGFSFLVAQFHFSVKIINYFKENATNFPTEAAPDRSCPSQVIYKYSMRCNHFYHYILRYFSDILQGLQSCLELMAMIYSEMGNAARMLHRVCTGVELPHLIHEWTERIFRCSLAL